MRLIYIDHLYWYDGPIIAEFHNHNMDKFVGFVVDISWLPSKCKNTVWIAVAGDRHDFDLMTPAYMFSQTQFAYELNEDYEILGILTAKEGYEKYWQEDLKDVLLKEQQENKGK